jgi:hypothetical protein
MIGGAYGNALFFVSLRNEASQRKLIETLPSSGKQRSLADCVHQGRKWHPFLSLFTAFLSAQTAAGKEKIHPRKADPQFFIGEKTEKPTQTRE